MITPNPAVVTRLAPSPTGLLHLGNAWAFLLAWLSARSVGGKVILRIEDLDPQRSQTSFTQAILDDLHWLELDWDEGPDCGGSHGPYSQSQCMDFYAKALGSLEASQLTYPCFCTRKDLRSLPSAPQVGDMGVPYPGTCRKLSGKERAERLKNGERACIRLICPSGEVNFADLCAGPQRTTLADCGGDFALRRSDGVFAYQLAVAVDDARMGVSLVVRGRDILPSTPRQITLLQILGATIIPQYAHVPLLLDEFGERLAKRHKSLSLADLRQSGAEARAILGLLGKFAGLHPEGSPISARALAERFSFSCLPRQDLAITQQDIAKLVLHSA